MILPPCPDWNEDRPGDLSRIIANINGLWPVVEADAIARPAPSLAIALEWHRRIYDRVAVPHPDHVGKVRDSDQRYPCLIDYEVAVGSVRGVRARDMWANWMVVRYGLPPFVRIRPRPDTSGSARYPDGSCVTC